jgi:hypothetical protein
MDEQQVRQLVRQAIARHFDEPGPATAATPGLPLPPSVAAPAAPAARLSVAQFHLPRAAGDVECVIEPSVTCNHCGHCLCYGH